MKKLSLVVGILFFFFCISFVITRRFFAIQPLTNHPNKIFITTSFYPLFYFAERIGGQFTHVTNLTPAGSEPHDYDPSPQQMAQIQRSRLLILNGGGLEAWREKVTQNLQGTSVIILIAGENFITSTDEEHGSELEQDPHIWLNPVLAKQQVEKILAEYQQIDPLHQQEYAEQAGVLLSQLDSLNEEYTKGLQNCQQTFIVTAHNAFHYVATQYGFEQVSISGISPDEEPSAAQLAKVAQFVRENNIKYIFFESLISPKLSETIANETGAQTLVLNPLEGLSDEEIQSGKDYFSVMRENLKALKIALACQ